MTYATEKQIWFIKKLAVEIGFSGKIEALDAYGFVPGQHMSISDASLVIDWLKSGEAARFLVAQAA